MAKTSKSVNDMFEPMKFAGAILSANPALGPKARHFWQAQDLMLDEVQKFSSAWFKRRHEATQSALRASQKMASDGMSDPATTLETVTDWQAHSMERIAEDAKGCMELMSRCAELAVSNETEALEATMEVAEKSMKSSKSEPV